MQDHRHIRKISDRYSITLPKQLLEQVDLQAGAHVDIAVVDGKLVLEPVDVRLHISRRSGLSTDHNSEIDI